MPRWAKGKKLTGPVYSYAGEIDEVGIKPTLTAPFGDRWTSKAWLVDLPALRRHKGIPEGVDATVAVWVVEAPWAEICWHSYMIALIHLRPLAGNPVPPIRYLYNATHEIRVHAMDPDVAREPAIKGEQLPALMGELEPLTFAGQFNAGSDEAAKERVRMTVGSILQGVLNPDTEDQWIAQFGDRMMKKYRA